MMRDKTYDLWRKYLSEVPSVEQAAWIHRTLKSRKHVHIWGRYFFPHWIQGTDEVPDLHVELVDELSKMKDSGIILPRGFAKSTWLKIYILHAIVYKLEDVIVYVSDTMQSAKLHFASLRAELENNELLRAVYGNLVPPVLKDEQRKWSDSHFRTNNVVDVVARGAGKGRGVNILGRRPTLIVVDDVEDDEQVRSPMRREQLHDWLSKVLFPSLAKGKGRIKMIGTTLHEKCEVLQFYKKFGGVYRQAIENGESIWPNYWSLEALEAIRQKIGSIAFAQEYQNEPMDTGMTNFPPEWYDSHTYTKLPQFKHLQIGIHHDPQAGEKSEADEYCTSVLAWEAGSNHRYLVEQVAGHGSELQQLAGIVGLWQDYQEHVRFVSVEKVMNQTALFRLAQEWMAGNINSEGLDVADRNMPLIAFSPRKKKSERLSILTPRWERGEIHVRVGLDKLRNQLLYLGHKALDHDDRADSLIGAIEQSLKVRFNGSEQTVYNKSNKTTLAGNTRSKVF
jgi:hypothetical protein